MSALNSADAGGTRIVLKGGNYGAKLSLNGKSQQANYKFEGMTIASEER